MPQKPVWCQGLILNASFNQVILAVACYPVDMFVHGLTESVHVCIKAAVLYADGVAWPNTKPCPLPHAVTIQRFATTATALSLMEIKVWVPCKS